MRGGTSKGVVLRRADLPDDAQRRDAIILRIFGSPDRRQIDGLGGADPLTSKLAIVGPPTRRDADVDYTFGQVLIEEAAVDYGGYCGNIAAAVAAYAVDEGFVDANGADAVVRIHCTNMGRLITAEVPVADGRTRDAGDVAIAGVPGTGAPIKLDFADTAGSASGSPLPLGPALELAAFGDIRLSVVDVGNPMVFVDRASFDVGPADGPEQIDGRRKLLSRLEAIRIAAGREIGLAGDDGEVGENIPLVALVGEPADYTSYGTRHRVAAADMDLWARTIFLDRTHKAYGVSETVCTAAAAVLPGTVVHQHTRTGAADRGRVRIGHPSGIIEAEVDVAACDGAPRFRRISVVRTARRILDGQAHVPAA
jgi:2-methylaconitate cis-trans-isomerase PrpF